MNNIPESTIQSIESILSDEPIATQNDQITEQNKKVEEVLNDEKNSSEEIIVNEEESSEEETEIEEETNTEDDDNLLTEEYFEDTFVDIDGERVNLGELKKGFLRQSDYTKKTQELANQRKEAEKIASEAEARAQSLVRDRFAMVSLDVEKRLKDFQNIDWPALARTNPNDYTALRAEYESAINEAKSIESEFRQMQAKQAEAQAKQIEEQAKQSYAILKEEIPNWGKELYSEMINYAVSSGLPEETAVNIVDASALKLIYKAYMFDKGKTELKNNVKPKDKPSVKSKLRQKASITDSNKEKSEKKTAGIKTKLATATNKNDRHALSTALIADILGED